MTEKTNELKPMVRLLGADIEGSKATYISLCKIKGVSFNLANILCKILTLDKQKKIGYLTDGELAKIEDVLKNPSKYNLKSWLLNRQNDYETGEDMHILGHNLKFVKESDIKRLKKIKSNRGLRHQAGLPVRGQRTKGHFRKGAALGVKRRSGAKKGK